MNDIKKPLGIVVSLVVVALLIGMLAPSVMSGLDLLERKSEGETLIEFYEYENQTYDVGTSVNVTDPQIEETTTIDNTTYQIGVDFYDDGDETTAFIFNNSVEDTEIGFDDTINYTYTTSDYEVNYEVTFLNYDEVNDNVTVDASIESVEYTTEWDSSIQNLVGLFSIFFIVGIVLIVIKSGMEVY